MLKRACYHKGIKIVETNSEQWDINESGVGSVIAGIVAVAGGVGLLGWTLMHLSVMPWWWSLVGVVVALVGGLIIFSASGRQLVLRRQGMSEVFTTKFIGHKETRVSFNASQIASVNLDTSDQTTTSSTNDGTTTTRERTSVLYVLLTDNSEIVLAAQRSNSGASGVSIGGVNLNSFGKAPLADEAQRIASFYGVPLSSRANNMSGADAISSTVNAIKQGIGSVQTAQVNTDSLVSADPLPPSTAQPASVVRQPTTLSQPTMQTPSSPPLPPSPPIEPVETPRDTRPFQG